MKRTLFLTMTAAALLGGQAFAATTTATIKTEDGHSTKDEGMGYYVDPRAYGDDYSTKTVSGGKVVVTEASESGGVTYTPSASGGLTFGAGAANNNKATMKGGKVYDLLGGGSSANSASKNTVIMTGGTANRIAAGMAIDGKADGNVAIMSGGKLEYSDPDLAGDLIAGLSLWGGDAYNNKVHLVGAGAEDVTIFAADDTWNTYTGSSISIDGTVYGGYAEGGSVYNNSIDVYGTGISAMTLEGMSTLNFHLVDELVPGTTSMLNLSDTVTLSGVTLSFDALEDMSWKEGTVITLIQDSSTIAGVTAQHVNIYEHGSTTDVAAEGDLKVVGNKLQLSITKVNGAVPEPATATLSLLALAGLAARRRRK